MRKLLIVDDEAGVRALVRMTLEDDSFDIIEAADGDEALALARSELPRAILLDVMMPGKSGFDVCRELKSDPATASMFVMLLTAKTQPSDRDDGRAAGADAYIDKPFSPLALMARVDEIFATEART